MKTKLTLLTTLLIASAATFAQNWSYVGGNCCLQGNNLSTLSVGDNELSFKTNGNAILAYYTNNFGTTPVVVKEFDGTSWQTLPDYNATGTIGAYDLEMYNDEPYFAIVSGGKFRVKKFNGTNWVQIGDTIPNGGAVNFDFVIDNNGALYITFGTNPAKTWKSTGGNWSVWATHPGINGTLVYSSGVVADNTSLFDDNNLFHYVTSYSNILAPPAKQIIKTFDGTNFGIAGDTVGVALPSPYLFKNNSGELFTVFNEVYKRPHIKKLSGSNWGVYGDSSELPGTMTLSEADFAADGSIYLSGPNANEYIVKCDGSSSAFTMLPLVNNTSTLNAQIFDVNIHPFTGKAWISFGENVNNFSEISVMKEDNTIGINDGEKTDNISVFPNPASGLISINLETTTGTSVAELMDVSGKIVIEQIFQNSINLLNIQSLGAGVYVLKIENTKFSEAIKIIIQ
jgi:hypothetical protein